MKKIFCLIIAFGIFVTSGIFATTARAEEYVTDSEEGALFSCEPSITIDPETGNLGVDIYAYHENKVGFTNFEARIPFKGDLGNVTDVTLCKGVAGNADANIVKGDDGINYLNVIFSANKPVVSEVEKVKPNGDDSGFYTSFYIPKIMSIKTDKKAETEISDGIFSVKNLQFIFSQDTKDFVIEAGYKDNNGAIRTFQSKYICGFFALISGDFDFDGEITIKDVIAAQYYYVNGVEAMSFGDMKFSKDPTTGETLETAEVKKSLIPVNSYITQFITSNVAGIMDYGYVAALTLGFSQLATLKGSASDLTDYL